MVVQTLISTFTDWPELAPLHHFLFFYGNIVIHYLEIHRIICEQMTGHKKHNFYTHLHISGQNDKNVTGNSRRA